MNLPVNQPLTMSSREIAELTGKRHADVMRDIRNMLDEIQSTQNCVDYQDERGRTQPMLMLNKEETLCLVSGYNVKLRMSIIKRWSELEQSLSTPQLPKQDDHLVARRYEELSKAYKDRAIANDRIKALESQEDSTPLLANVKTQQQIEDEFMLSVINSSKATDIFNIECNAIRRKNNPFKAYKRRGMAREMLRKSVSRLIDSGSISSKQVGIQSH